jgi:hypothetical protein
MRIAKPMLLIATPFGVIGGVYEAFRLAGGLAFLMIALIAMIGAAIGMLVMTIRREQRAEQLAEASVAIAETEQELRVRPGPLGDIGDLCERFLNALL